MLGTAGDLLFMGDIMGKISAFDKDTMQELWSFDTGTAFAGTPMTYSVNGKQYIALMIGGRLGRDEGSFPEAKALGQTVMLMVFGLMRDTRMPRRSDGASSVGRRVFCRDARAAADRGRTRWRSRGRRSGT